MHVFRLLLLGLAVCVMTALGWHLGVGGRPARPEPAATSAGRAGPDGASGQVVGQAARDRVETELRDAGDFGPVFSALKRDFPHSYDLLVVDLSRRLDGAGALPSPDEIIWDALRVVQQSRGLLAAGATEARLRELFDARLAVLDALAPIDPRQCADFLYGVTDPALKAFTASHRGLVATLVLDQIAAMKDGQEHHGDRAMPTAADFDQLTAGLAQNHLSPDEIAVLLDGVASDPPTPEARLCAMGRIYLSVLRELPPDVRQRVYGLAAELLARS